MEIKDLSVCFHTTRAAECKQFYVKYLNGVVVFDFQGYLSITFGTEKKFSLSFMEPGNESVFEEKGITVNFEVDNVDDVYEQLIVKEGLTVLVPLGDNPWGDRSFTISDPLGNIVYIYTQIEPSEEFLVAFK